MSVRASSNSNIIYYTRTFYRNKRLLTVRDWVYDPSTRSSTSLVSFSCVFLDKWPAASTTAGSRASTLRKDSGDLRSAVSLAFPRRIWIRQRIWRQNVRLRNGPTQRVHRDGTFARTHTWNYISRKHIGRAISRLNPLRVHTCTSNLPSIISMTISRRCRARIFSGNMISRVSSQLVNAS